MITSGEFHMAWKFGRLARRVWRAVVAGRGVVLGLREFRRVLNRAKAPIGNAGRTLWWGKKTIRRSLGPWIWHKWWYILARPVM